MKTQEKELIKGLSPSGKLFANQQLKKFRNLGFAIPYGLIRKAALKLK